MTALTTTLPLPLDEACHEVEEAMRSEGFVLKASHRLDPKELGLTELGRHAVVVVIGFDPPLDPKDMPEDPLRAAFYLCQVLCEEASPYSTRIYFSDYDTEPIFDAGVPADVALLVRRRLERVHATLSRRN